ncbi:hypothetical protein SAMN05444161_9361 [Rhizobiales bacterium GAS191]|nr:hypothetical protein SAMN05444161_6707 [Rhizobiales bacterium GAS191]SEF00757.1 hypothetical protein SAMN05519104_7688 [Rhizobiales bacterium GAS188]SEF05696.1 hypothetical protein SAMN05519104_8093 [Rhizobiales bacterium GAS188]SEF07690.1 hypothetical protein SAMN05519104_8399 [Rhizobiales bacterium GAS188]SEF15621.1 hypothetical protein SAMN05444161_9361 [Rhizobiales bacterium GAS191]
MRDYANRKRFALMAVLVLLTATGLVSCGTPRCTTAGCGFDSKF